LPHEGTLTTWKDDKGFGFIKPTHGGPDVFVHVSSFANKRRRPVVNDHVEFASQPDTDGRLKATSVRFHGEKPDILTPVHTSLMVALGFIAYLGWSVFRGTLPSPVLWLYLLASGGSYLLYRHDKRASKAGRYRIPEGTLHISELIGGWPGALVAQQVYQHKTAKLSYQFGFWICVIINCAILYWISSKTPVEALIKSVFLMRTSI